MINDTTCPIRYVYNAASLCYNAVYSMVYSAKNRFGWR
jgi:hypothetical protein